MVMSSDDDSVEQSQERLRRIVDGLGRTVGRVQEEKQLANAKAACLGSNRTGEGDKSGQEQ